MSRFGYWWIAITGLMVISDLSQSIEIALPMLFLGAVGEGLVKWYHSMREAREQRIKNRKPVEFNITITREDEKK